jgi:diguanylate cyclase (GGDEF)-like protein/PAS domain S-box-containing protein
MVDAHVQQLANPGQGAELLVVLKDRQREWELEQQNEMLSALVDSCGDLMYAYDTAGCAIFANRTVAELLGRPVSDIKGRRRVDLIPLHDAIAHRLADQRVLADGLTLDLREELRTSAAEPPKIFATRKFLLTDRSGRTVGVGGVSRDVTDEVQRTQELRLSELVFQHTADAIIIADRDGRIVRVNPAFTRLTGFSLEAIAGRSVAIMRPPGQSRDTFAEMRRVVAAKGHWTGEMVNRNAHGALFSSWLTVNTLHDDDGNISGYVAVQTDLSELRQAQSQIDRLAYYDLLTGLPNRALLLERAQQALWVAERRNKAFALLFIDLDHFKDVNDSLGHATGDILLQRIAARLSHALQGQETVARLGGDEFVVLLPETDLSPAIDMANSLLKSLRDPVDLPHAPGYVPSLSIGLAVWPLHGQTVEDLLQHADTAMYEAKAKGRARLVTYTSELGTRADMQFHLQNEFLRALREGEIQLHYQPKVELQTGRLVGAEGLIRWHRNAGNTVMKPGEFLWAIGREPLLRQLDDWVLQEGVRAAKAWAQQGVLPPGFRLSVNQTATNIDKPEWSARVARLINEERLQPGLIEIELTEDMLIRPTPITLANLENIRNHGVSLAIDDFGTGYSSLSYLQRMPVTAVKIDQSFVRNIVNDSSNRALVESIVSLAHSLGHEIIAEGVETEEQRHALIEAGCALGQGYLFARPMPRKAFEDRFLNGPEHPDAMQA